MTTRVRLKSVHYFTWHCPECRIENRHNGRVCRDTEVIREVSEETGEDFEYGDLMDFPSQVACHKCEGAFGVIDETPGEEWRNQ